MLLLMPLLQLLALPVYPMLHCCYCLSLLWKAIGMAYLLVLMSRLFSDAGRPTAALPPEDAGAYRTSLQQVRGAQCLETFSQAGQEVIATSCTDCRDSSCRNSNCRCNRCRGKRCRRGSLSSDDRRHSRCERSAFGFWFVVSSRIKGKTVQRCFRCFAATSCALWLQQQRILFSCSRL